MSSAATVTPALDMNAMGSGGVHQQYLQNLEYRVVTLHIGMLYWDTAGRQK